jgi:hypothetical protein
MKTEELGEGSEVVFWQKVAWWGLPNNQKGKYVIGSTIHLTVDYQSDFKTAPLHGNHRQEICVALIGILQICIWSLLEENDV